MKIRQELAYKSMKKRKLRNIHSRAAVLRKDTIFFHPDYTVGSGI